MQNSLDHIIILANGHSDLRFPSNDHTTLASRWQTRTNVIYCFEDNHSRFSHVFRNTFSGQDSTGATVSIRK